MSKENLKDTMGSLFDGMEGFLTSKTVVGEPIYIKDTIILPLVDVSFGMGAGAFSGDKKDKSGGGIGGKTKTQQIGKNGTSGLSELFKAAMDMNIRVTAC